VLYVTVEAAIARRPEVVWDVLTDVPGLTAWVEGLIEAEVVSEEKRGVGMRVRVARREGSKKPRIAEATCEVTAWREHELLAIETRVPGLLLLDRVTLTRTAEGTDLGFYAELFYGSAFSELFARPVGLLGGSLGDPAVQGIYERSVEAFVKRVEAISAKPYR
jgi:hypothetical protein